MRYDPSGLEDLRSWTLLEVTAKIASSKCSFKQMDPAVSRSVGYVRCEISQQLKTVETTSSRSLCIANLSMSYYELRTRRKKKKKKKSLVIWKMRDRRVEKIFGLEVKKKKKKSRGSERQSRQACHVHCAICIVCIVRIVRVKQFRHHFRWNFSIMTVQCNERDKDRDTFQLWVKPRHSHSSRIVRAYSATHIYKHTYIHIYVIY